ncbi:MAG: hypothetical protein AAE986_03515 [Thermoplasmataceae archaeon]
MNKKYAVIFIAAIMVLSALTVAFSLNEIVPASPNVLHSDYKDTNVKATDINPKGGPSLLSGAASYDTSITMNSVLNPSTGYSFTNLFSSKNAYYTINPTTLSGQKYKISFALNGLPSGASWNLIIIPFSLGNLFSELPLEEALLLNITYQIAYYNTSSSTLMTAMLPNGTYVFYAGPENTFLNPVEFNVSGTALSLNINFPAFNLVYFDATTLQTGVSWNVYTTSTLGSETGAFFYSVGSSSTLEGYLPAGNYEVESGPLGTYIQQSNYTVVTSGGSITEKFTFPAMYKVTFTAKNLMKNTEWLAEAYLSNASASYVNGSSGSSKIAYLPNSVYNLFAVEYDALEASITTSTLTVNSAPVSATIDFPFLYEVTFVEERLPANMPWGVTVSLTTESSIYENFTYGLSEISYLANGSYTYSAVGLGSLTNYFANPNSLSVTGGFNVSGASLSVYIQFPQAYDITISHSYLPAGLEWYVYIISSSYSYYFNYSFGSIMHFYLSNGSYPSMYIGWQDSGLLSTTQGFNVSGHAMNLTVKFPYLYQTTFTETNAPAGISWSLTASPPSGTALPNSSNQSLSNTIMMYLANSSYTFAATIGSGYSTLVQGSFTVAGSPQTVSVAFPALYMVTITEENLPLSVQWSVSINNLNNSITYNNYSEDTTMIAYLPNTNYDFTASAPAATLSVHAFSVNGGSVSLYAVFPQYYKVTVNEVNLRYGLDWGFSVEDSTSLVYQLTTSEPSLSFYLPNGTYLTVVSWTGVSTNILDSSFTVSGKALNVTVKFPTLYIIEFTAKNVPANAYWTLYLSTSSSNITVITSTGALSTTVYLPNDTYSYYGELNGASTSTKTLTVAGANLSETVVFPGVYTVTFNEKYVPAGTSWAVDIFNSTTHSLVTVMSTNLADMSYSLENGSYYYNASYLVHYGSSSTTLVYIGPVSFVVKGANLSLNVVFQTYKITFDEQNLLPGSSWSISLSTKTNPYAYYNTTTDTSMIAYLPNDTYTMIANSSAIVVGPKLFNVSGVAGTIQVIFPPNYKVTFNTVNLPAGLNWTLMIYNSSHYEIYARVTNSPTLSVGLPNGTYYAYSSSGFFNTPQYFIAKSFEFYVTGSSEQLNVVFPGIYAIDFQQTGLPAGISWNVTLSNSTYSYIFSLNSSISTKMIFYAENGTYNYVVGISQIGWKATPSSGAVSVNGKSTSISLSISSSLATVTFSESGLPANTVWSVTINGSLHTSSTNAITIAVPNGTYAYTVTTPITGSSGTRYADFAPSGSVDVKGVNLTESVSFITQYYLTLSVSPSGSGTVSLTSEWLNASSVVSITAIAQTGYSFSHWNGTGSGSYSGTNNPASVTMNGPVQESAVFVKAYYKITFSETGLPSGISWYVNITGMASSGAITSSTYSVTVGNGSFTYNINNLTAYYTNQFAGTVTVDGSNQTVSVTFEHYAYITGTLNPTNATLSINGKTETISSSGSFNFSVPAGNYNITASASGYNTFQTSFSLSPGSVKSLQITLTAKSTPTPPVIPSTELYEIIGGVVAIVVIGSVAAMALRRHRK